MQVPRWDPRGPVGNAWHCHQPALPASYTHPAPALQSLEPAASAPAPAQPPPPRAHQPPGQKHSQGPHCSPRYPGLRAARAGPQCSRVLPRWHRHFLYTSGGDPGTSPGQRKHPRAGARQLPPACPGKGPAGRDKGQLPTRAGQVLAVLELLHTEQTAATAPGPRFADGGPSSRSRVRRGPQAEPSSHPRARLFRAFILEKVKACRYSNKIYKKIKIFTVLNAALGSRDCGWRQLW